MNWVERFFESKTLQLLLLVVVLTFVRFIRPEPKLLVYKSLLETKFEQWASEVKTGVNRGETTLLENLQITLSFNNSKFTLTPDPKSSDKALRILELAEAANIFSLSDTGPNTEKKATFEVSSRDSNTFAVNFSETLIDTNTKAQLLLKLLKLYSEETPRG